jgi:signal peptidase I
MKLASRIVIGVGVLAAILVAFSLVGPRALGGPADYVITHGSSMEPKLQDGDLVVLRGAKAYEAGDVVAYRSGRLGRVVLHRIVRTDGERFVTKGDNNSWLDSYRPTEGDVVGRAWFTLPVAGAVLNVLRSPRNFAIASALLTLLAVAGTGAGVRRRRLRRRPSAPAPRSGARTWTAGSPRTVWIALAAAAAMCLGLAVISFAQPAARTAEALIPYEHSGAFSYSVKAPAGPVYAGRTVRTGQPVFLRLVDRLPLRYSYSIESGAVTRVRGTARLTAELTDESGWRRVVPLGPETTFAGSSSSARGTIDLRRVWILLRQVQAATGLKQESYGLTLVANVAVRGMVAGQRFADSFAQRVQFRLDSLSLQLVSDVAPAGRAGLFRSERGESVQVTQRAATAITVLGRSIPVTTARRLSAAAGGAWLLAALAALLFLRAPVHEPARIRSRYGSMLVALAGGGAQVREPIVDVATIDALVRVAESAGRLILHGEADGAHTYVVDDDGPVYRYRAYENEGARSTLLAREAEAAALATIQAAAKNGNGNGNANGNGNGHHVPASRPGLVAQLLGAPGRGR